MPSHRPPPSAHRFAVATALTVMAAAGSALHATPARASEDGAQRVAVTGHYDNAVGSSDAASHGVIRAELL